MLQPTTKKIEVKNYPYGSLRTSMFFSVEFKSGKGYRSVTQSINPKTGKMNKPHYSTYHQIILLDETDGFCKFVGKEFYKIRDLNALCQWISQNWALFTTEQHRDLYLRLGGFMKLELHTTVVYCGADVENVKPLLKPTLDIAIQGLKNPDIDLFSTVNVDTEALDKTRVEGYQPFTVKAMN
jgi:hypothetical protein